MGIAAILIANGLNKIEPSAPAVFAPITPVKLSHTTIFPLTKSSTRQPSSHCLKCNKKSVVA